MSGRLAAVGNLTSRVDHCTPNLIITWTAPYTLPGFSINYTINIRHSDGAVLRSDTTNTTEYLYAMSSPLGETLDVAVAAVNGAGTGNVSSVHITSNVSSVLDLKIVERNRSGSNWTYVIKVS